MYLLIEIIFLLIIGSPIDFDMAEVEGSCESPWELSFLLQTTKHTDIHQNFVFEKKTFFFLKQKTYDMCNRFRVLENVIVPIFYFDDKTRKCSKAAEYNEHYYWYRLATQSILWFVSLCFFCASYLCSLRKDCEFAQNKSFLY